MQSKHILNRPHTVQHVQHLNDLISYSDERSLFERSRPVPNTVKHVHNVEDLDKCHIN